VLVFETLPAEQVTVGVPVHASVAEGAVWLAHEGMVGLHPKSVPGAQLSNEGAVVSSVHVHVLEHVDEFWQPSVAVHVIVLERPQVLVLLTLPSEHETDTVLKQLSVAEGAVMLAQEGMVGLQPKSVPALQLLKTGAFWSTTFTA
jgi:hypothetical protein